MFYKKNNIDIYFLNLFANEILIIKLLIKFIFVYAGTKTVAIYFSKKDFEINVFQKSVEINVFQKTMLKLIFF